MVSTAVPQFNWIEILTRDNCISGVLLRPHAVNPRQVLLSTGVGFREAHGTWIFGEKVVQAIKTFRGSQHIMQWNQIQGHWCGWSAWNFPWLAALRVQYQSRYFNISSLFNNIFSRRIRVGNPIYPHSASGVESEILVTLQVAVLSRRIVPNRYLPYPYMYVRIPRHSLRKYIYIHT